jgi:uncharacterized protein (DUF4415 family)
MSGSEQKAQRIQDELQEHQAQEAEGNIVRYVSSEPDGFYTVRHADGRLERLKDQTNWERLDALTEEDIVAAMRSDPDWADMVDVELDPDKITWTRAVAKTPVSLRLDSDVVDFFKEQGPGYQTRMNDVLRAYVEQTRQKKSA